MLCCNFFWRQNNGFFFYVSQTVRLIVVFGPTIGVLMQTKFVIGADVVLQKEEEATKKLIFFSKKKKTDAQCKVDKTNRYSALKIATRFVNAGDRIA